MSTQPNLPATQQQQQPAQRQGSSTLQRREPGKNDIFSMLDSKSMREKIAACLPRHMTPDRMCRVMVTALRKTPKLQLCTQDSLLTALMKCSEFGLEPNGYHAHLIPYGDTCQLIFDYKGLVDLIRRSGQVKSIHCDLVCENDTFDYQYGSGQFLRHKLALSKRGEPICAYSFVVMSTGEESFEVLTIDEIYDIRDGSQGYQAAKKYKKQSPWDTNFGEMAKKTALRRHSKWLPLSGEIADGINGDDEDRSFGEETRSRVSKPVMGSDKIAENPEMLTFSRSEPEQEQEKAPVVDNDPMPEDDKPEPVKQERAPQAQKANPKPALTKEAPELTLAKLLAASEIEEGEVIEIIVRKNWGEPLKQLGEYPADVLVKVIEFWDVVLPMIKQARG